MGAFGFPMHAAVGRLKQALAAVIEHVGIMRRDHEGRGPLEAVLEISSAFAIANFGMFRDIFELARTLIEARDLSFVIAGIDDVWGRRVGGNLTGFPPPTSLQV